MNISPITIQLRFKSGSLAFFSLNRVKTKMFRAYDKALTRFAKAMERWATSEVPEDTSILIADFVATTMSGPAQGAFQIGNPTTNYASYVNQMSNVNWSKWGRNPAKDHYFKRALAFMVHIIDQVLVDAIHDEGLDLKLSQPASQILRDHFVYV